MARKRTEPGTVLYPVPVVLVTCQRPDDTPNIITLAWVGTVCSEPPMVSISIRPERFSHGIIKETGEFVINVPTTEIVRKVDLCGVVSGKDGDKFEKAQLTPEPASKVAAPLIKECPVCLECVVEQTLTLGTHDVFIAEIVAVQYDESVLDEQGRPDFSLAKPFAFAVGEYREIAGNIGSYGFSEGTL